jgi:rSAM/selenodomain-associated transferase 1
MASDCCCVLFTKPARPGRVKTRLIGALSSRQAAALHQAFLDDILLMLSTRSFALRIAWALDEGEPLPNGEVRGLRQSGGDLGARLLGSLQEVSEEFPFVMALGSDHPEIVLSRLEEAFLRLKEGADMVLGPATDGGYYLIALRRSSIHPELFDGIPWSSPAVFSETLERSGRLGLKVDLLAAGEDVDSPEDLERLIGFLAENPDSCRHTGSLLREWGHLE